MSSLVEQAMKERGITLTKTAEKPKEKKGFLAKAAGAAKTFLDVAGGFITKPIVNTLAKPVVETVAATNELVGKQAPEWTNSRRMKTPELMAFDKNGGTDVLFDDKKKAAARAGIAGLKEKGYKGAGFEDVLNVASLMPGVGLASKGAALATRAGRVASGAEKAATSLWGGIKASAPAATAWGGAYGAATAVDQRKSAGEVVGDTAKGAAIGLGLGVALPVVGAAAGKVFNTSKKVVSKDFRNTATQTGRKETLTALETKYSKTKLKKVKAKAEAMGFDITKAVADSDLLVGAADANGNIATKVDGGAYNQMSENIAPYESMVSDYVKKEGKSVSLKEVEARLIQKVNSSGIPGAAKVRAINQVKREVSGLRLDSKKINGEWTVPLVKVHETKIYKGTHTNFLDPDVQEADKAIRDALKELVEENTDSIKVKEINRELSYYYTVLDYLEELDGKKIDGGRLGKYFMQTIGAIAGAKGGPLGSIAGASIGDAIHGAIAKSTFGSKTGAGFKVSQAMDDALRNKDVPYTPPKPLWPKGPKLGLPAPDKTKTAPTIPLRGPTTFEPKAGIVGGEGQTPRMGFLSKPQELPQPTGATGTPILMGQGTTFEAPAKVVGTQKTGPLKVEDFIDAKATIVEPKKLTALKAKAKPKTPSKTSDLTAEAKKYKSAEEFVKAQKGDYQGKNNASGVASGTGRTVDKMKSQVSKLAPINRDNTEALEIINRASNNPEAKITIYRGTTGNSINHNDWVFLTKLQAEKYTTTKLGTPIPGAKVVSKEVLAKDVDWTGKNLEFAYNQERELTDIYNKANSKGLTGLKKKDVTGANKAGIPKELNQLAKEAAKFDSADDFAKAYFGEGRTVGETTKYHFDRIGRLSDITDEYNPTLSNFISQYPDQVKDVPGLKRLTGNEKTVTIYRSATGEIQPGDWVAFSDEYASGHSRSEGHRIFSKTVPASDIRWAGTSAEEWFYAPKESVENVKGINTRDALRKFYSEAQGK